MSFANGIWRSWRPSRVALAATLALSVGVTVAADLASIVVVPERGQTPDQARRDRYDCHNRTVAQTGTVPLRRPAAEAVQAQQRAERIERVMIGAGIGALAGSVIRGSHDADGVVEGAVAGGIFGAIAGAIAGRNRKPPEDPAFEAYARALGACLEARGYTVSIPE